MANKIIFSSKAAEELEVSYLWYENQSSGLGVRFTEIIDKAISLLLLNPEGFPKKRAQYREIVIGKFPFVIIYEFIKEKQVVYILHIFHTKQNPKHKYKR